MSATALELIGREVSLPVEGSRSRRRGYIAEIADSGKPLVAFYESETHEEVEVELSELRLLAGKIPAGWRGIDVETMDGTPWLSLRVRPEIIEAIKAIARNKGLDMDGAFNYLIKTGLELAIARHKREKQLDAASPDSAVT